MALVGNQDFRNSARISNLPKAIANGQPSVFEQLVPLLPQLQPIPADIPTAVSAGFPLLSQAVRDRIAASVYYATLPTGLTGAQIVALLTLSGNAIYDYRSRDFQFQDTAGTTPVTADGQPVRLVKPWLGTNNLTADAAQGALTSNATLGADWTNASPAVMRLTTRRTGVLLTISAIQQRAFPNSASDSIAFPFLFGDSTEFAFHPPTVSGSELGVVALFSPRFATVAAGTIWIQNVATPNGDRTQGTAPYVISCKPIAGVSISSIAEDRTFFAPTKRTYFGNRRFDFISSESFGYIETCALNLFVMHYSGLATGTFTAPSTSPEQLSSQVIPAASHTVPLTSFPRLAYYDTADGIIKESRSDDQNKLAEMIVTGGSSTTLTIRNCVKFTAHGYPLGRALFVAATGGLSATIPSTPYYQRAAIAPHADYLVFYTDPPRLVENSKLTLRIPNSPFSGKNVAILGDSITQFAGTWSYLNEFLGTSIINNHGISSSSVTWHPNNTSGTIPMQASSRINAIAANNNLIIVFGGTNDWFYNVPLGTITDINVDSSSTSNTFYGAINQTIDLLRARLPFAKIMWMTPMLRNYNYTEAILNTQSLPLKSYADAIVAACGERSVSVIDFYKDIGIQRSQTANYTFDGVHPDIRGYLRLQYFLAARICLGSSAIASPPIPAFFWTVFDQSKIQSSDSFWVLSNNDIVYVGNIARSAIFFGSNINTIEFTIDSKTGIWLGFGGNAATYTAAALNYLTSGKITDFTPPTFSTIVDLPTALVTTAALNAMTRFRVVKDATGFISYGFDGTNFVQTHPKIQRENFPLTGWASNYSFAACDFGFQNATLGSPEGNWTMMKNVSVNGIPLFQAIQYGGI